jgi:hypothetical protein
METIIVKYSSELSSYLDSKKIQWSSIDDFIKIYLPKDYTMQDVWQLAIEFKELQELQVYQSI